MAKHSIRKDFGTLAIMGVITFAISSAIYTNTAKRAQLSAIDHIQELNQFDRPQHQEHGPGDDSTRRPHQGPGNGDNRRPPALRDGTPQNTNDSASNTRWPEHRPGEVVDPPHTEPLCGNGVCEPGEDREVVCPACLPDTPPEHCRCKLACEEDCSAKRPPKQDDRCSPIECADGSRHESCGPNGEPINYFMHPCDTSRGDNDGENSGDHPAAPLQPYCEDGDGGMDIYTAGRTESKGEIHRDECQDDTTVFEYFCRPGLTGERVACPHGCKDGACIKPEKDPCAFMDCAFGCVNGACIDQGPEPVYGLTVEHSCKDSDGGNFPGEQGELYYIGPSGSGEKKDRCLGDNRLMEHYCEDNEFPASAQVDCPMGCENGRCIEENDKCAFLRCQFGCDRGQCKPPPYRRDRPSNNGEGGPPDRANNNAHWEYQGYNEDSASHMRYGIPDHIPPYAEFGGHMGDMNDMGHMPHMPHDVMNMSKDDMLQKLAETSDDDLPPGKSRDDIREMIEKLASGEMDFDDIDWGPEHDYMDEHMMHPWDEDGDHDGRWPMDPPYGQPYQKPLPWEPGFQDGDHDWEDSDGFGSNYDWNEPPHIEPYHNDHNTWDKTQDPSLHSDTPPAGYEDVVRVNEIDAPSKNWFSDTEVETSVGKAANVLADRAVIGGYPDGTFRADNPVNRAEAAKFLLTARHGQVPDMQADGRFWDVRPGEWYVKYVMFAADLGIINGNPDGSFRPGNTVNTAEFLKMLSITFELPTGGSHPYTDVPSDAWFADYAGIAAQYALFEDRTTQLNPQQPLTRGEVAIAIAKMLSQS